jgi:nicotinamidase/pyrazinamidase
MRPAIIITDMIEDFVRPDGPLPIGEEGLKIIPNLCELIDLCRQKVWPVVYANDALMADDFLFQSRMKPHAIRGTAGAGLIGELRSEPSDLLIHKPRFSAFFKTDLDIELRERGIDTVVLGGIATEVCILSTAYEAVCHNFEVIVLEDCCASRSKETHGLVISMLKKSPLYPLLRVTTLSVFLRSLP